MKKLFCLYLGLCLLTTLSLGQEIPLEVHFESEGQIETITELKLTIVDPSDTIIIISTGNVLKIPKELFGKKVVLDFTINGNNLAFHGVPVAWNDKLLQWNIGLDRKPFDKERFWNIKKWKKVKEIIYYLDYGNGKQVTEYQ